MTCIRGRRIRSCERVEIVRKLIRKCALALALPSVAAVLLVGGTAPAALASTPVLHFAGSPGTSAPPTSLGPYTMTKAAADSRPLDENVSNVTLPDGTMSFSTALDHTKIGDRWATWSNGYTGDVYIDSGITLTMTLPAGTLAFYFYLEPATISTVTMQAVAQNGTTSGPVSFSGFSSAKYFGFYGTGGATIKTIEVTLLSSANPSGFAVGEFGAGSTALQLAALHQAVQGVGTGTTLAGIVALAQQQLSAGHTELACLTLAGFTMQVKLQQFSRDITAAVAATLIADAKFIQTLLGGC
jgi:hypothetical protein